ncbi:protein of unknown function [Serratia sp. Tan611]|nr:protein of unknown function [Serratia sp. Tan611]
MLFNGMRTGCSAKVFLDLVMLEQDIPESVATMSGSHSGINRGTLLSVHQPCLHFASG